MNFLALIVAAIVPTITGMIWYNKNVFGNIWMKSIGLTEEEIKKTKGKHMAMMMVLSVVFAFMLTMILHANVIHQFSVVSLVGGDPNKISESGRAFLNEHLHDFRTFKHGLFHGILVGIFFVFPIIATNGIWEKKKWSYILVQSGYWVITLGIMGGIICAWEATSTTV